MKEPDGAHDDITAQDPTSVLDEEAIRLHEIYLALRRAKFTKIQAENFIAELVPGSFGSEATT